MTTARTSLALQAPVGFPEAGIEATAAAADTSNGNRFKNVDGQTIIIARNSGTAQHTVQFSMLRREQAVSFAAVALAPGRSYVFGPFADEFGVHAAADGASGEVYVTASHASVLLTAFSVPGLRPLSTHSPIVVPYFSDVADQTALIGTPFSFTPTLNNTSGLAVTSYELVGTLPTGLSLNTSTGAITGTSTLAEALTVAVIAHFADGSSVETNDFAVTSRSADVSGATLWLKFDEASGDVAADSSGNAYNGTWSAYDVAHPVWGSPGLVSDGANDGHFANGGWTLGNLFKAGGGDGRHSSLGGFYTPAGAAPACSAGLPWRDGQMMARIGSNYDGLVFANNGGTDKVWGCLYETVAPVRVKADYTVGVRAHFFIVWDGNLLSMYKNGVFVESADASGVAADFWTALGIPDHGSNILRSFNGTHEHFRIYPRALTAQEVSDLYAYLSSL